MWTEKSEWWPLRSCNLSACNNASAHPSSLAAIGNHLHRQIPQPRWVSPSEQGGLLWTSSTEGRAFLLNLLGVCSLFAVVVSWKYARFKELPWHVERGPPLYLACSHLLAYMSSAALARILELIWGKGDAMKQKSVRKGSSFTKPRANHSVSEGLWYALLQTRQFSEEVWAVQWAAGFGNLSLLLSSPSPQVSF